ncbi:MAG: hypothetical protein WC091_18345 [Sulfuricellaceae bacterium]
MTELVVLQGYLEDVVDLNARTRCNGRLVCYWGGVAIFTTLFIFPAATARARIVSTDIFHGEFLKIA